GSSPGLWAITEGAVNTAGIDASAVPLDNVMYSMNELCPANCCGKSALSSNADDVRFACRPPPRADSGGVGYAESDRWSFQHQSAFNNGRSIAVVTLLLIASNKVKAHIAAVIQFQRPAFSV